jgi:hypothetical protein
VAEACSIRVKTDVLKVALKTVILSVNLYTVSQAASDSGLFSSSVVLSLVSHSSWSSDWSDLYMENVGRFSYEVFL